MPQAAQATRQTEKGQSTIEEVHPTVLMVTLPVPGLLPKQSRPLSIWPVDDLKKVLPGDAKHTPLRALIAKIKPGSGKIDHLVIMPGKKCTMIKVQVEAEYDSRSVRTRVESALKQAGYPPKAAV